MREIIKAIKDTSEYSWIKQAVERRQTSIFSGLTTTLKSALAAALFTEQQQPILIITDNEDSAAAIFENLRPFLGNKVAFFPSLELMPFEVYGYNLELVSTRINTLSRLSRGEKLVVVCSVSAASRRLVPSGIFADRHMSLRCGDSWQISELAQSLSDMGYENQTLTEIPGSYSLRGSIVDIFPINSEKPVRVEFFDDEIESIRFFETDSQLSGEHINKIFITPARELPLDDEARQQAISLLDNELSRIISGLHGLERGQLLTTCNQIKEYLHQGIWDNTLESMLCLFYEDAETIFDYSGDAIIIVDEPKQVKVQAEEDESERQIRYADLLDAGRLLPSFFDNFCTYDDLKKEFIGKPVVLTGRLNFSDSDFHPQVKMEIMSRELPSYAANPNAFKEDMQHFRNNCYRIVISVSSEMRRNRVEEIMRELEFPSVDLIMAEFTKGFESPDLKLVLISEKDLFARESKKKQRRIYQGGEKIANFLDLKAGDYVVHISQGIGQYMGVQRLDIGDIQRDYLLIRYSGEDKLYVPVDQLDLVQKYIGNDGSPPKIYRLGGSEWNRAKNKARASVRDMAKELLALYAEREKTKGYVFAPDTVWQQEFEDGFPYEETPDQLLSLSEIKTDMESEKVMDRLLCGDVGYGKTEIALRAAFKAVMDGKQVAVLAPTTVLAQQHHRTITDRFSDYPVKSGCLSRFNSPKEQKELLASMADGSVDIVVGTHRLLSNDVKFKDLGLLIVDEEQRFGVAHKEKIKALKASIDVLTLSATPIPRTLHMSLVGMRDMSIINTPPADRRPVQTYVVEHNQKLIRDAIARELGRGGQVYYVHNRVFNIFDVADELAEILPNARILVAHGQMKEKELEQVMLDFVDGNADILLCTTIIESGLDIPNVNTLIVDEADTFGLSQLYQLRGRVGRSKRQAFAYFTYRKNRIMSDIAKKRLIAIRDFTELGAGFKIAMRDLELRGAGNILGPEQHGNIVAVGFDLYCKLLQEEIAIAEGKEEESAAVSTLLELQLDAYIPDRYINDSTLKVEIYKRISAANDIEEIDDLTEELTDRYGDAPIQLTNLILLGKLKVPAKRLKIISMIQKSGYIEVKFADDHPLSGEHLMAIVNNWQKRIAFSDKKGFSMKVSTVDIEDHVKRVRILLAIISELKEIVDNTKN